ncbi:PAS domain S-box protein [Mesorhizobium sp. M7A.F.Ca.US.011.01.1.1]|nr:PAS domain S-box protein [Mesorhizobium sp. M7A.F.Ca.US.011.01.1.1]
MHGVSRANVVAFNNPGSSGNDSLDFDYQDFFENGAVALDLISADGLIFHANKAELDLFGYPAEDYVGRHVADFYLERDLINDIVSRLTRDEKITRYPARLRARDGSIKHRSVLPLPES